MTWYVFPDYRQTCQPGGGLPLVRHSSWQSSRPVSSRHCSTTSVRHKWEYYGTGQEYNNNDTRDPVPARGTDGWGSLVSVGARGQEPFIQCLIRPLIQCSVFVSTTGECIWPCYAPRPLLDGHRTSTFLFPCSMDVEHKRWPRVTGGQYAGCPSCYGFSFSLLINQLRNILFN